MARFKVGSKKQLVPNPVRVGELTTEVQWFVDDTEFGKRTYFVCKPDANRFASEQNKANRKAESRR